MCSAEKPKDPPPPTLPPKPPRQANYAQMAQQRVLQARSTQKNPLRKAPALGEMPLANLLDLSLTGQNGRARR